MSPFRTLALALLAGLIPAAEYQFAVDLPNKGRGLLWIPPDCTQVRGLIYGHQVILEKLALDDPAIRRVASELGFGVVLCKGLPNAYFVNDAATAKKDAPKTGLHEGGEGLLPMLQALAEASGYREVATAPMVVIGHSGGAIGAWQHGYWRPDKTIAIIGLHAAAIAPPHWDGKANVDGIPVLGITGEWEMWTDGSDLAHHIDWLRGGLLEMRGRREASLVSELVQPGAGHFNWDARLAAHVADFIRAAAALRLPSSPDAPLHPIAPAEGWLGDITLTRPPGRPIAPFAAWTGDPALAFWHPSEDLARRSEAYALTNHGKKPQMLTFVEDGAPLPAQWIVGLKPQVQQDGETVQVKAAFIDRWPEKLAGGGTPLGHAASGSISYQLIGGWGGGGAQTGPDTFRLDFSHLGCSNRFAYNVMLVASHPGDGTYGYTEMAACISFPERLSEGAAQHITVDSIADQPKGAAALTLHAVSDAGLPVRFAVKNGPARIENGNTLVFTQLPPRTTTAVPVTVMAWQRGTPHEPKVRTAEPVEVTFRYGGP